MSEDCTEPEWPVVSAEGHARIRDCEGRTTVHRTGATGRQVAWHCCGDGPPLVLLHGGHGNWLHWARNLDALAATHRLWVADLPGFGASDPVSEQTLEGLLEPLLAALDDALRPATPFALAGFSFGGLVAAHVAARRGRLVTGLALLGPGGHGTPRRPRGELLNWRDAATARDAPRLRQAMHHNLRMHMLHDASSIDALALQLHTEACLQTRFRSKPISLAGGLPRALDDYTGPLLLAWGEHDVTATPEPALAMLGAGRTGCTAAIVPGAGHWVAYEAAEVVNGLLAGLLRPA